MRIENQFPPALPSVCSGPSTVCSQSAGIDCHPPPVYASESRRTTNWIDYKLKCIHRILTLCTICCIGLIHACWCHGTWHRGWESSCANHHEEICDYLYRGGANKAI